MNKEAPFRVRTYGWVMDRPGHVTPGTKGTDTMLILNVEGVGHYRHRTGEALVCPSTVGLIPPEDPGVLYSDTKHPYVHAYCRFGGDYAQQLADQILLDRKARFFPVEGLSSLIRCLSSLPPVLRKELPQEMGELELGLAQILVALSRKEPPVTGSRITRDALLHYMEQHMDNQLNLTEMAVYFQMTKPALCRAGKKLLGDTLIKTNNAMRMESAAHLLENTAMNISEVAHRVGFEDPYYFSRVFKAVVGMSPKKWQLRRQNE